MPQFIVKLERGAAAWYLEWSAIVDAPVTKGMSLVEFREHIQQEYGRRGVEALDERLDRVEVSGTSLMTPESARDAVLYNRAGPDETELTYDQIVDRYCL